MNGGCNHAANDGNRYGLHHIRADAALPQNRNETRQHYTHGHEFWPESLHSAFDCGLLNVFVLQRLSIREPAIESIAQVDDHDHACLDRRAKQRDVANDRQYDLQPFFGLQFKFVFACPFAGMSRRQRQVLCLNWRKQKK